MTYIAQLEAVLFVAGEEGVSLRQLGELLDLTPSALYQQLERLKEKYDADENSALCLLETAKTYKLVTKAKHAELLRSYAKTPINQSLSRASLEVLSIIAYKQPVTRVEVDDIRGVNSSGAITKLLSLGLIKEDGKKEVLGRPNLYVTTDYFLDFLGINHLDQLPDASAIELREEEVTLFKEKEDNQGEKDEN